MKTFIAKLFTLMAFILFISSQSTAQCTPPSAQTKTSGNFTSSGYAAALGDCNILTHEFSTSFFDGYIERTDAVGTTFTWTLIWKTSNASVHLYPNPDDQHLYITLKPQGAYATYRLTVSNSCGSYSTYHTFAANVDCVTFAAKTSGRKDKTDSGGK